jgi:hypothetical protein
MTTHPDIPPAPVLPPPLSPSDIPGGRPVVIVTTTTCLYPLHPADNYAGPGDLRHARGLPPETPIVIQPQWPPDTPGTWHWCQRCTRRNAGRTAQVGLNIEKLSYGAT